MNIRNLIYYLASAAAAVSMTCSCSDINNSHDHQVKGTVVDLGAVSGMMTKSSGSTKAADEGELLPLEIGTRFAARLYFDNRTTASEDTEFNTMEEGCLKYIGADTRCRYTDAAYTEEENGSGVHKFYWNNRKYHGFVAFFLSGEATDGVPSFGGEDSLVFRMDYKVGAGGVKYQDDPMLAVAQKRPVGGTNEANRVNLIFEHQTACVQVKVKPDGVSVGVPGEEVIITSLRLLGTADSVIVSTVLDKDGNHKETIASETCLDSLVMVLDAKAADGYKGSATALAFGTLRGLGVTWREKRTEIDEELEHHVDFMFPEGDEVTLQSGKKYIYSVSLRRGTIATINLDIIDWEDDEADDYAADGSIHQETSKI